MNFDHLDPATRRLVIQIQLQDLQHLLEQANRKGKGREGEFTGFAIDLDVYKIELAEAAQVLQDRELCKSICRAVSLDADLIGTALVEEEQALQDRNMALHLGDHPRREVEVDALQIADSPSVFTNSLENVVIEKLRALYVFSPDNDDDPDGEPDNLPESSAWGAARKSKDLPTQKTEKKRECVACTEKFRFFELASCTGCAHEYCRECLKSVFEASLTDERYFPPRCCRNPIQVELCRLFLSLDLVERYKAKKLEFDTPNRTYCSQPTCSVWVPPQFIKNDIATCQTCQSETCAFCKASSHAGTAECPEDPSAQALLDLAAQEGWQRCYSCKRVVDLMTGCNHITCPCQAQFCYVCGQKWKTCRCEHFDENRLLDRAAVVVNRRDDAHRIPVAQRGGMIRREMEHLRANHQCEHTDRWRRRGGGHRCEECHDFLPNYIWECSQCRLRACTRCRYNRL